MVCHSFVIPTGRRTGLTFSSRALSLHLFVASILLLREWRSCAEGCGPEYENAIEAAISLLEQVKSRSAVAHHAIQVLRKEMSTM